MDCESLYAGAGLSEEAARELARIGDGRVRALAAVEASFLGLDARSCGAYVDEVLARSMPAPAQKLLASVTGAVEKYRAIGGNAELLREDSDNGVKLTVRLAR